MPPRRRRPMLPNHPYLPVPILEVLTEQPRHAVPRVVPAPDSRRLPHPAAAADNPEVELVVLVSDQFLVEAAEPFEVRPSPASKVDGIDRTLVVRIVRPRSAGTESGVEGGGNRSPDVSLRNRYPWATDVVGTGRFERVHALAHVIRRVFGVHIGADDDVTARDRD